MHSHVPHPYSSSTHHKLVYCKFFGVSVAHLSWFIGTNGTYLDGIFNTKNEGVKGVTKFLEEKIKGTQILIIIKTH